MTSPGEVRGADTVAMIAIRSTADLAIRNGVNVLPIAERVGISQSDLRNMTGRVAWPCFLDFLDAVAEALGGPEAAFRAGADLVDSLPDISPIAARFVTPIATMRFVYEVVDHLVLPMVNYEVSELGPDCVRVIQTIRDGYEFRPLAVTAGLGVAVSMPRYLGRGNATLDIELTPRGARHDITFPPAKEDAPRSEQSANPVISTLRNLGLGHLRAYGPGIPELMGEASLRLERLISDMVAPLTTPAFLIAGGRVRALNEIAVEMERYHPGRGVGGQVSSVELPQGDSLVIPDTSGTEVERRLLAVATRWGFTGRQVDVLRLLVDGFANKDIGARLDISHRTVEVHLSTMLRKVGASSRAQLLSRFWETQS